MFLCLEINKLSCNFEVPNNCQWAQDSSDDFDWTRHQGGTRSAYTGPTTDHTKSAGECYILLAEVPPPSLSLPSSPLPSSLSPLYMLFSINCSSILGLQLNARAGIVLELFLRRVSSWLNYRMAVHFDTSHLF